MHIMVDIETMGTRPNAPIISIGAVAFDGSTVHSTTLHRVVSLKSSVDSGAVIDPGTVMWWMRQSDMARAAFEDGQNEAVSLEAALRDLGQMVCLYGNDLRGVWGNGASFDNVVITESCRRLGMAPLWEFWKDRCYRTVKNMYPNVLMQFDGTAHNALDDAISQARHLVAINQRYGNFL